MPPLEVDPTSDIDVSNNHVTNIYVTFGSLGCIEGVAMAEFIGRERQLAELERFLARVQGDSSKKPGRAVLMRGRRRVGKSRLVEEFLERSGVPFVFFTASAQPPGVELRLFCEEVAASSLPGANLFAGVTLDTWEQAIRLLGAAVPVDRASVIVLDELPYLTEANPALEGTLQKMFDRDLSNRRVLLIGVGSDLAMMEALNEYGRPFHQRATEMVIPPLSPADVGAMLELPPAEAFDAFLVTGGLPLICNEWQPGASVWDSLEDALSTSTSALIVSGERALAAEFPALAQARVVLGAIGSGETTFVNIGQRAGGLSQAPLARALGILTDKRVVAVDQPLSTKKMKEPRYRIADPYLRFWLRFIGPHLDEVERGRGDLVLNRIRTSWPAWRGRAIEPVVREALSRLVAERLDVSAPVVGGYWTRNNSLEIDIVVADRAPVATRIHAIGSIKWHETGRFDHREQAVLERQREQIPGGSDDVRLIAASRSGCDASGVEAFGPAELIAAWSQG